MRFAFEFLYLVAAVLFIVGLKFLSSPARARQGNSLAAFGMVVATVTLSGTNQRPMGGAISRDGKFLYMTTGRGKTVAIIDTAARSHVGSIEVGERPWGIAISQDDRTLFTANGPSNDVSIVDIQSRSVKARVKVGDGPWGALFVP